MWEQMGGCSEMGRGVLRACVNRDADTGAGCKVATDCADNARHNCTSKDGSSGRAKVKCA